jgi:protein required for attachment to host cells
MTPERANEIERKVIYIQLNYMPYDTIDNVSAFHVGRMLGMMQKTLHDELEKEVVKE